VNDIVILPASEWHGCYDDGWQGEIVPEAFAHPAKVSRALIRRIYQHAFVEGWLVPGDTVVDPFGGIAGTALDAMWSGLTWIGCELEPKFVGLAGENIEQWQRKYGGKAGFGSARILQGDSRKLSDVIAQADVICSSPPYSESLQAVSEKKAESIKRAQQKYDRAHGHPGNYEMTPGAAGMGGDYGSAPGQLGRMKEGTPPALICSSPPYATSLADGGPEKAHPDGYRRSNNWSGYGDTPGQLERLREGDAPALICSSPPYAAIATGAGGLNTKPGAYGQQSGRSASSASQTADQRYGETAGQLAVMREGEAPTVDAVVGSPPFLNRTDAGPGPVAGWNTHGATCATRYGASLGESDGQLGAMPEGRFDAVVSSPPYETGGHHDHQMDAWNTNERGMPGKRLPGYAEESAGQLSGHGDTFWSAAREIVAQCHQILRPGGHAIWITKDFVRKGKRVPFSDQWQALCEAEGFRLVCRHRAMLVKHHGSQDTIFGDVEHVTTQRKSFFRRLAEKKGSPPIDFEDVICMERA
jgi:hypothetical protein